MKSFKQICESIVDEPRRTYAKDVFDKANTENPRLKKSVKDAILSGVRKFQQIAPSLKHRVIGGILTKQYNDESDIDVNILFDVPAGQRDTVHKKLRKKAAEVNGKSAPGTKHPINYFVLVSDEAYDLANQMADNVYNLEKDEFEKKSVIRPIDLDDYMSEFQDKVSKVDILTGELRRDVIDYASLKRLSRKEVKNLEVKVKAKLEEIENGIQALISTHKEIKSERMGAFLKKLTPAKLRKYGSQNALPKNVIYKLMEKYYYLQFFLELEKIIGDDKELSPKEADKVIDATQKFGFSPVGNPESDSSEN
jgi:hypothetical protein